MEKKLTIGKTDFLAVKKALLIMKLTLLLLVAGVLQVSANANGQTKISLKVSQEEITTVLNHIEKQSDYRFLYNSTFRDLHQKISLEVHDMDIRTVLNSVFSGTALGYKILQNNLIVIFTPSQEYLDTVVRGKITSETGEPLFGVSVTVKGTTFGTTTDSSGAFTLSTPAAATLRVSYVGYESQEIKVGNNTNFDIRLRQSANQMDQVVVVGYGTQKKIDVTGATATIKGAELIKQPVLTATQAIQGKAAGVQIIGSGQPGTQPSVRIRGTGSMLGGAEPLYVVDGVLTTDITNINTSDIVNVDVLKDASSTAIYGARGANGVIIITTKQGAAGKMQITYNGNVGIQTATHLVKMADARQYANYVSATTFGITTYPLTGYNTSWYNEILRHAVEQSHSVSVSGGSDRNKYLLSAGYSDDQGIVIGNYFKRFTMRLNDEFKLADNLKLGTLVSYTSDYGQNVALATAYNDAYRASPLIPAVVNGKYGNTSLFQNVGNPVLDIKDNNNLTTVSRLQGNGYLEYKPVPWLTLRSSIGADWENSVNRVYTYQFLADTSTYITAGGNQSSPYSVLTITTANSLHWVWDNTATFNKRFGDHNLTVLVGTTAEKITGTISSGTGHGVPANQNLWNLGNADNSLPFSNTGSASQQARNSYIGRINYSYKDKYLLTGNFRADGSSTFPVQNRWGYFPSVGVGWVISREDFMRNQTLFDLLKIRGSWGKAGNDVTGTGTQGYTLTLLENLPYFFGGTATSGNAISQIIDQNLKWESTTETDAAVEFSMLRSKLTGEFSVYDKKVNNALIYVQIPGTLGSFNSGAGGQGYVLTNAASIENKGIELTLNWRDNITKDLSYSVGGNITFNKNNVVGLNGGQPYIDGPVGADQPDVTKTDNGHPIGSFYVQKVLGVFQSQNDIDNYRDKNGNLLQSSAQPGDFKYQFNSNGQLDSVYAGSYQPKAYYGVNFGINYKQFDLSVTGYGAEGGKIYNGKKAFRQSLLDNIEASTANNAWTMQNHSETEPRPNAGDLPASTYFVEPGGFFRINNINLGYTISSAAIQRTKVITSLRIYLAAQNVFTFTKYSGFTPEVQTVTANSAGVQVQNTSPTSAGIELNAYPTARTFSAGVNVGF